MNAGEDTPEARSRRGDHNDGHKADLMKAALAPRTTWLERLLASLRGARSAVPATRVPE